MYCQNIRNEEDSSHSLHQRQAIARLKIQFIRLRFFCFFFKGLCLYFYEMIVKKIEKFYQKK